MDLEQAARTLATTQDGGAARAFRALVAAETCSARLVTLAQEYSTSPEIAIPACERAITLSPREMAPHVQLALVHWLLGEDDAARNALSSARAVDEEDVSVLTLRAALTHDKPEVRTLYERILEKDPNNAIARANIGILDADASS